MYDCFRGTVSNGMTFIVELKHDVYTFRWDKEALSFGGITILKLLHKWMERENRRR